MLVAGANGLIGSALVARLERDGHEVVLAVRDEAAAAGRWPGRRLVRVDYAEPMACTAEAAMAFAGIDVVINAAGIFRERGRASFEAVHVNGPCSLFALAAAAGVGRLIQISALGARPDAPTAYLRSKAHGDACAWEFPGRVVVVRPSLVFAGDGASTRLFLRLASLPLLPLPQGGSQCVQPLHLADLCDGVAVLATHPDPPPLVNAVGPDRLSLAAYLQTLAAGIGRRPRIVPVPPQAAVSAARALKRLPGSLVDPDALAMLQQGNCADARLWRSIVGRPLRPAGAFIGAGEAAVLGRSADLANLLPLLRASVSLTWLATAWISAFVYPRAASLDLLHRAQVPEALAPSALYAAAALDALLGLGMWSRRWRRAAYGLQLAAIGFYTLVISLWLPEFWAHPYGPVLKNLPLFALICALMRLEDRDGPGHR